jgi:hypothetical protein
LHGGNRATMFPQLAVDRYRNWFYGLFWFGDFPAWGRKMPQYRAYFIDAKHIVRPPDVLVCDDDEAAIARARSLVSASDIELWHLDRLVFRFPRSAGAPA